LRYTERIVVLAFEIGQYKSGTLFNRDVNYPRAPFNSDNYLKQTDAIRRNRESNFKSETVVISKPRNVMSISISRLSSKIPGVDGDSKDL